MADDDDDDESRRRIDHLNNKDLVDSSSKLDAKEEFDGEYYMDDQQAGWLQLGIGSHRDHPIIRPQTQTTDFPGLIHLELMPATTTAAAATTTTVSDHNNMVSIISQYYSRSSQHEILNRHDDDQFHIIPPPPPMMNYHHGNIIASGRISGFNILQNIASTSGTGNLPHQYQEINSWGLRHTSNLSPSSNSLLLPAALGSRHEYDIGASAMGGSAAAQEFMRVIQPDPSRPSSAGLWLILQASQNQLEKESVLPQLSKRYLRIKDGRMTIGLVIKYLVIKLNLDNENEIEVRCKGQRLQPSMMLQHVRDNIWYGSPRDFITLFPNSSTIHHIMLLQYLLRPS